MFMQIIVYLFWHEIALTFFSSPLFRQPLITNTSTKSNFMAFVGKSTHADWKMTPKEKPACMFHLPLSSSTDLNVSGQ